MGINTAHPRSTKNRAVSGYVRVSVGDPRPRPVEPWLKTTRGTGPDALGRNTVASRRSVRGPPSSRVSVIGIHIVVGAGSTAGCACAPPGSRHATRISKASIRSDLTQLGIQPVPHPVAEDVERQHGDEDRDAGQD